MILSINSELKGDAAMRFVFAAKASALPEGSMTKVTIGNRTVLLARLGGEVYALDNKCPHMGGSLADGKLEDGLVVCPRHGATFEIKTGKLVRGAKIGPLKFTPHDATSIPVKVEGEDISVGLEP
jgi:3-phenylpropionate/trans-cinnamate dioxygenase ferredoxin subunit